MRTMSTTNRRVTGSHKASTGTFAELDMEEQLGTTVFLECTIGGETGGAMKYLELSLPKFSLTAVTDLRSLLSDMHVEKELLGSKASFERLSSTENFTVDKVFNKVLFEMSEEGSEDQSKPQDDRAPLKLTVNRPFFFAIVEGNSNAILMLGKIRNPTV